MTAVQRVRSALFAVALFGVALGVAAREGAPVEPPGRFLVVLDPGHGGSDHGARGVSGLLEKDIVLRMARRIGSALEQRGVEVVFTRKEDRFVTLPERTRIANRARGDLYLSIHANASDDRAARGAETYFLSLEASDEEARRVAMTENRVFDRAEAVPDGGDLVGAILGDLIRTDHLRVSSEFAHAIQRELGRGRGVKQAPFVVLMGVNMPAALLEIGFVTHRREERALRTAARQRAIATAVADAVHHLRTRAGEPVASPAEPVD